MLIGLDYDETFTRDPKLWEMFIKLLRIRGHDVVMVTYRYKSQGADVYRDVGHLMNIIFTGQKPKRETALRYGYKVDVWIDDLPELIP